MTAAQVDEAIRGEYRLLVAVARGMLGSEVDAEDVVQNALVSYVATPGRAEPSRALLVWLVRKRCLDELRARRARREHRAEIDGAVCPGPHSDEPLQAVVTREDLAELATDLERLPEQQRRALMLAVEGTSHDAVARELGLSSSASRALVARARTNLRLTRAARATPCAEIRVRGAAASAAGVRAPELVRRHLWTCVGCRLHLATARERAGHVRRRVAAIVPQPLLGKVALVLLAAGAGAGVAVFRPWEGPPAPATVQHMADALRHVNARMPLVGRADLPADGLVEVARNGALRLYAQRTASGAWCMVSESAGHGLACVGSDSPEPISITADDTGRVDGRVLRAGAVRVELRVDGRTVTAPVGRAGFFTARARRVTRTVGPRLGPPPSVTAVARDAAGGVVARWSVAAPGSGHRDLHAARQWRSPARTGTASRFGGGANGHVQRGS